MICVICKRGSPEPGHDTATFTRGEVTVVIRQVPALVCPDCGEAYYDETVTDLLLSIVNETVAAASRVRSGVAVLEYAAA